jgi:cell division protein FtsL
MAAGVLYPTLTMSEPEGMSQQAMDPVGMFIGTPEIYFAKRIDNSRVLRMVDPKRRRELASFAFTLGVLLMFAMMYVWQHFSSIEYGYKIEQLKSEREAIMETNRALKLEESSLRDLSRIDALARQMGLQPPAVGQLEIMDSSVNDTGVPVLAKANEIMVVSAMQ